MVDGQRLDWTEKDIFVVPSWAMHAHVNASEVEDACLFCFNDLPVLRALDLYREEESTDADDGTERPGERDTDRRGDG